MFENEFVQIGVCLKEIHERLGALEARCPDLSEPRHVPGPSEILAKIESLIERRIAYLSQTQDTGWSNCTVIEELRQVLQEVSAIARFADQQKGD